MKTFYQTEAALGTQIHMAVVTDKDKVWADDVLRRFWLEVLLFEKRCSRFIQSSELSQFNRAAGIRSVITPEFRSVLSAAKRMGELTDGLYNPFVLPALQRAGYKQSLVPEYAKDEVDDHSTKQIVGVEALEFGDSWASIPYGTAIDLGGCGKGFIGDALADMADEQEGLAGYWFSIGGDVVTAGRDEQGEPWTVYITPHVTDISEQARIGAATAPSNGRFALATSTVRYRAGVVEGRRWHHIIDPRSGKPADTNIILASICGSSLLEADVLASCAIIIGHPEVKPWLKRHAAYDALLQIAENSGSGEKPVITTRTIGQGIKKWL
jgi:FAD:protein FMN transferase